MKIKNIGLRKAIKAHRKMERKNIRYYKKITGYKNIK